MVGALGFPVRSGSASTPQPPQSGASRLVGRHLNVDVKSCGIECRYTQYTTDDHRDSERWRPVPCLLIVVCRDALEDLRGAQERLGRRSEEVVEAVTVGYKCY